MLSIYIESPQSAHLSVLVTGFSLIQFPGNLNLGQGIGLLNWKGRHLLGEEYTVHYTAVIGSNYPFGILFFLGICAMKSKTCLCCCWKCGKSNLATANYFIPKSIMCMAVYPKYKLISLHAAHFLSPSLGSQVHLKNVSIILTKWLFWLKLVKAIKYGILILSTNRCAFSKNLLWGITVLFIICLLIYFKYFPLNPLNLHYLWR